MPKSILDIEVKDDQFKAFIDKFNQYQERLKELPGDWGNFDEGTRVTAETFATMTAALLTQREILHQQERDWAKQEEAEKRLLDLERRRKNEIHSIWEDTKRISSQVASTTQDLFRWIGVGSILSGLAGAGGLWGLDALAHQVSDTRKTAMGIGVRTGQLQSAQINFGPYLGDPTSTLQSIAEAKSNLAEGWVWAALGLNPNQDPATLMQSAVGRAGSIFGKGRATPIAQDPRVKAFGELGISLEDLRRIHNASQQELADAQKQYQQDQKQLQISEESNREWQKFAVQMGRASDQIKNAFVDTLEPVIPELTQMSKELAKTIQTFLTTDKIKALVKEVGSALEDFVKYVGTPKFQKDIQTFATDIGEVAEAIVGALKFLHIIKETEDEKIIRQNKTALGWLNFIDPFKLDKADRARYEANIAAAQADMAGGGSFGGGGASAAGDAGGAPGDTTSAGRPQTGGNPALAGKVMQWFMHRGWTQAQAAGIVANLMAESNLSANPRGSNDNGAAYGSAQWHADRQADFNAWASARGLPDIRSSSLVEQLQFIQYELTQGKRKWVGDQLKATNDPYAAGGIISRNYESPKVDSSASRGRAAVALIVTIQNQTGAHVSTQAQQLPQ